MVAPIFEIVQGDAGYVTAIANSKVGIISRWNITRSGLRADGSPKLRFRAQFAWINEVLMNMKLNGMPVKKRVVVQMKTKFGQEDVDILGWTEWHYEGGVLTLEEVLYTETIHK